MGGMLLLLFGLCFVRERGYSLSFYVCVLMNILNEKSKIKVGRLSRALESVSDTLNFFCWGG